MLCDDKICTKDESGGEDMSTGNKETQVIMLTVLSSFNFNKNHCQHFKELMRLESNLLYITADDKETEYHKYVNIEEGEKSKQGLYHYKYKEANTPDLDVIYGIHTNEPAIKNTLQLEHYINKQTGTYDANDIDDLIIIATDAAGKWGDEDRESYYTIDKSFDEYAESVSGEFFKKYLSDDFGSISALNYIVSEIRYFSKRNNYKVGNIHVIPIENNPDSFSISRAALRAEEIIQKGIIPYSDSVKKKKRLYLDSNGGFRDIMSALIGTLRALKVYSIMPDVIYSNDFERIPREEPFNIYNKKDIYSIFDLVSGLDEFIKNGKGDKICDYFRTDSQLSCNPFLIAMSQLSNSFLFCNPEEMIKAVHDILHSIYVNRINSVFDDNDIFGFIADKVWDDFGVDFTESELYIKKYTKLSAEDKRKYNIPLITWCIKKNYIQQAAILYTELVPELLFSIPGLIPVNLADPDKAANTANRGMNRYADKFYTELYDSLFESREVNEFRKYISDNINSAKVGLRNKSTGIGQISKRSEKYGFSFSGFRNLVLKDESSPENKGIETLKKILIKSPKDENMKLKDMENLFFDITDDDIKKYIKSLGGLCDEGKTLKKIKVNMRKARDKFNEYGIKDYIYNLSQAGRDTFELVYGMNYGTDNEDVKQKVIDRYYNYEESKTYRKKIYAIMNLHNNDNLRLLFDSDDKAKAVENVMAAYLFVKLLRNKMAHANDSISNEDEEFALNKLKELYHLDINGNTIKIKNALYRCVGLAKGAKKA